MKRNTRFSRFLLSAGLLAAFVLWTWAVTAIDVQPIGPNGTAVGFAALNGFVHRLTGVHLSLYTVTDLLGLIPVAVALSFAVLGLCQWIRRGSPFRADGDILALGIFYLAVLAAYLLFEEIPINYRPTLIDGRLEVSYPSSTTLLVLTVMPTAAMQAYARIKHPTVRRCIVAVIVLFIAFTVGGRLICGVHWLSDIIGGILLSAGLVLLYDAVCGCISARTEISPL